MLVSKMVPIVKILKVNYENIISRTKDVFKHFEICRQSSMENGNFHAIVNHLTA